ncbi:hypothetical protein [Acidovorax lacteus]|uniref:Uncharacterized protein n=1 Tax=Acidovorax lacteus TaxID=1924988 RepID=A0ABP8L1U7_9BURK
MFGTQDPKPVDIVLLEPTAIDGQHFDRGTLLQGVPGDLAMELAGQGKARIAKEGDQPAKAAKKGE